MYALRIALFVLMGMLEGTHVWGQASALPLRSGQSVVVPSAQVRRGPSTLRRIVNKARRMPQHTKLVIGMCLAGAIVFFVGIWAKTRM